MWAVRQSGFYSIRNHLRIVVFAPLAPQFWGEPDLSPPELGDLGG
jgi:hypothetical protein